MKFKFLFFVVSVLAMGCASQPVNTSQTLISESQYNEVIYKNTDSTRRYSGFTNILDMHATVINSEVAQAQTQNSARIFFWDDQKLQEELNKATQKQQTKTEFHLSFYVPDRRFDDLWKEKTTWRIFITIDGRRIEGKPEKVRLPLPQLIALYPYHNRFYSPYLVSFPIPTTMLENKQFTFTVTGMTGSGELIFNAEK